MAHIDPERLALMALGEPVESADDAEHLTRCDACAADFAGLRHAARTGRATLDVGVLEHPRDVVWDRIVVELGLSAPSSSPDITEHADTPAPRRRTPVAWWGLAAGVVAVAGAGLGVWVWTTSAPPPTEIAAASLVAFPDHSEATGSALVEQNDDGSRSLHVEVTGDAAPDTYREVWLIAPDASELVSLGVLDGDTAVLTVPDGVDLADFPLVDVSQEPVDGDPEHSGDSIVRGALSFR